MAVHIASRVNGLAGPGEVLVSGTVFGTVVGGPFMFADRGLHELKGVPGRWPLFALGSAEGAGG
jgi:class 3 adenylate cyclase